MASLPALAALAAAPDAATSRFRSSVYIAPAGPGSRTVTYRGIRSERQHRLTEQVADHVAAPHTGAPHQRRRSTCSPEDTDTSRSLTAVTFTPVLVSILLSNNAF
jgi:hypothetical protein